MVPPRAKCRVCLRGHRQGRPTSGATANIRPRQHATADSETRSPVLPFCAREQQDTRRVVRMAQASAIRHAGTGHRVVRA
eukprot:869828-Rhodomonas_salina.2